VLARRSIHNVSGGGIVRKVPPSVAFDKTFSERKPRARSGIHVRTKAYSLTGCHSVPVK
jgi:hypothetical protein